MPKTGDVITERKAIHKQISNRKKQIRRPKNVLNTLKEKVEELNEQLYKLLTQKSQ